MGTTQDATIAELQRTIAELRSERDAALEQQTAAAEVLRVINTSPGDLAPVFDTIGERAIRLCDAAFGGLMLYDGNRFTAAGLGGVPPAYAEFCALSPSYGRARPASTSGQILAGANVVQIDDLMDRDGYRDGDPASRALVDLGGARTLLGVALRKDAVLLGAITIYRQEVRPFTDRQVALLQSFAAQAVIAMENARLINEQREALEQQTATAEVLQVINASPGNLRPVFETLLEKAVRLSEGAFGTIATYDGENFHSEASRGVPAAVAAVVRPMESREGSPIARLLETKRPVHILDLKEHHGYRAGHFMSRTLADLGGVRTDLIVPLLKDGAVCGLIGIHRQEVRAFSDKQIALLENFAAQAVIAIENARLLGELRQRTGELAERNAAFAERIDHQAATIDVLKVMSASPGDTQPVFDLICQQAVAILGTPIVGLFEFDGTLVHLRASSGTTDTSDAARDAYDAGWPRAPDRGSLTCRAILDGAMVHIRDLTSEPGLLPTVRSLGHRTQVTVPLMREGRAIGAITTASMRVDGISDIQIQLLQTFAEQAVIAIGSVANFRALRERTADLAQRQAELRVTFENMGDGVAMFDETQHLVAWNTRFQDIIDVPDEIIARRQTFPEYVRYLAERGEYGADADGAEQVRRLTANLGQPRVFERTRPNGRVIEIRNNPVAGGGFVLIDADITERKRNEAEIAAARDAAQEAARTIDAAFRELKTAQANLIQAEKMASLGQLTAGIAHEIKNPLNFVNNFSALSTELIDELRELLAPEPLSETARAEVDGLTGLLKSNLEKVVQHGQRADGIVKSMLEHSRGASGERRTVDINALAEEALNLAYHGARAQNQSFNITLERDFAAGIAPIELNPQDMTRVLLNLFSNGFYAANKRAREQPGFEPKLKVATRDAGDTVEIRVRDNGIGIPGDIRDKLFQPFFTTKPTGEGTGLGLSITYDIVTKQHGGTIAVDSAIDAFTEFVVTLPRQMFAGDGRRA